MSVKKSYCLFLCVAFSIAPLVKPFMSSPFDSGIAHLAARSRRKSPLVPQQSLFLHVTNQSKLKRMAEKGNQMELASHSVWAAAVPSLVPLKEATSTILAIFLSNEWQTNLIKNVLTILSVRFILQTLTQYRKTSFQAHQIPRYAFTAVMLLSGVLWLDATFIFPVYAINLVKHVLCMSIFLKTLSKTYSQRDSITSFGKNLFAKLASIVLFPVKRLETVLVHTNDAPDVSVNIVNREEENIVKTTPIEVSIVEEDINVEAPEIDLEETEIVEQAESKKKGVPQALFSNFMESLNGLATIQDDLAELQLETIPAFFSVESYEKTQKSINKMYKGTQDFFKEDE